LSDASTQLRKLAVTVDDPFVAQRDAPIAVFAAKARCVTR
jgi:hypothetical protein